MTSEFRVMRHGNSGDGFMFTIEEVYHSNFIGDEEPIIVQHEGPGGILRGYSVEDLRKRLKRLEKAFDKPVMARTRPKLIELGD